MNSKEKIYFICTKCDHKYSKWIGKCTACGEWNSIIEKKESKAIKTLGKSDNPLIESPYFSTEISDNYEIHTIEGNIEIETRVSTRNKEFNRVLGGGLVPGSVILIGGDPGIGKSTLLLQVASTLTTNHRVLYVSGEESINQIRTRSSRLQNINPQLELSTATNIQLIEQIIISEKTKDTNIKILVIDSIQTMYISEISSAPGTVSQIRSVTHYLVSLAKKNNITILIVGHVTKEGQIAGPRLMEHMVDTVLYFEGDNSSQYRLLRAAKNRFGTTNEIGIFEMTSIGLISINNPSELFLSHNHNNLSGISVTTTTQGLRTILLEIQALVATSYAPSPKRAIIGWDSNRLSMIIAVIHAIYGLDLSKKEVYLNVTGGIKIQDPSADLACAMTIISAALDISIPKNTVIFGEIGLAGDVRSVTQTENRIKEAEKLGFSHAIIPKGHKMSLNTTMTINYIEHIKDIKPLFTTNNN